MSAETELLLKMYAAFNRREIETVLSQLHPDVDWPNAWEGGRVHGHAEVREYWTRQRAAVDPSVEPNGFEPLDDGRLAVDVHQVVRDLDGRSIGAADVRHVYSFRGELIVRMDVEAED